MNKKTIFTISTTFMIFLISAQTEAPYLQEKYIQGFNKTINVDHSSVAILTAIKSEILPNGKPYNPNPKGSDLKRDFRLFKNSYGKQKLMAA